LSPYPTAMSRATQSSTSFLTMCPMSWVLDCFLEGALHKLPRRPLGASLPIAIPFWCVVAFVPMPLEKRPIRRKFVPTKTIVWCLGTIICWWYLAIHKRIGLSFKARRALNYKLVANFLFECVSNDSNVTKRPVLRYGTI
jgi:hypothetical protein